MSRNNTQEDLLNELHHFLKGALKANKHNPIDLTKTAFRLLKLLPAARTAIFQYFCNVFIELASNYIQGIEVNRIHINILKV